MTSYSNKNMYYSKEILVGVLHIIQLSEILDKTTVEIVTGILYILSIMTYHYNVSIWLARSFTFMYLESGARSLGYVPTRDTI